MSRGISGPVYGAQWRRWKGADGVEHDQLADVIASIKTNPYSRRHIVSAWNVAHIEEMALPPCHLMFQFFVDRGKLSCQLYQRSADLFLGVPFNIASYALLTMMVAQVSDLAAGRVRSHLRRSASLRESHGTGRSCSSRRKPRTLPVMRINPAVKDIDEFKFEDFTLENYDPWPVDQGGDCGVKG